MPDTPADERTHLTSQSSRHSIMWLLALLMLVFLAGLFLLSNLNLRFSQDALSDLRRQQIQEVVSAGLTRINARQSALASYTLTLANLGEQTVGANGNDAATLSERKAQLEQAIVAHFEDFEGAAGAGLWFEPGILAQPDDSYLPYFIRRADNNRSVDQAPIQRLATENRFDHYRQAPWYSQTLEPVSADGLSGSRSLFWSPVYFDLNSERAVLTLASPMRNDQGQRLGFATTAWESNQIIDLVSRINVTEHSFAFLNDRNNRNLSSLSQGEDTQEKQALIDAILALDLGSATAGKATGAGGFLTTQRLTVDGTEYELFYAATDGGLVYGAGVPLAEINAVLRPMEQANFRILAGTVFAMLLLSVYLLYRIYQLIRELQASYTDSLTGLPNRARLLRDLQRRRGAALLILNLDRFSQINSLFGNECGDRVLLTVAKRLALFRLNQSQDNLQFYRLPGDEFAVLTDNQDPASLQRLAEAVRQHITHERIDWQQQRLTLDVSLGLARRDKTRRGEPGDQLVSQAKVAVVQARELGRHYLLYDAAVGIEENYENNLYWANRLKEAIEQDRLLPWFQPIYDNRQGRVTKYECLVRMVEPDGSVISAGRFVDIANKLRLNQQIAALMIEKCFAVFQDREDDFSINLSAGDITEPDTVNRILSALESSGIGHRVIFEILESDGIANYDQIRTFIQQVKPFGCRIAIDDFGTGYSNFAHLLSLKVDIIKIDGSLIRHLHEGDTAMLVTRGIVEFARSLNMQTVAEFVHNDQVQARVQELGIDFSQGEYISMPVPAPGDDPNGSA